MTVPRLKIKVLSRPVVKVRALAKFPSDVVGAGGIEVVKANGRYTIQPEEGPLGNVTGPGPSADVAGELAVFTDGNNIEGSGVVVSDLLTEAEAAAAYQPLDSDLTAIAALTTQTYGRSLLTAVSALAARTALGVGQSLAASATYYVNGSTGNDTTGDGSSGAPWATLTKATAWTQANLNLAGQSLQINVAAGTYTDTAISGRWSGQINPNQVYILGDQSTPSNVVLDSSTASGLEVGYAAMFYLRGFKLTSSARSGMYVHENAWVTYDYIDFGACTLAHTETSKGGVTFDFGNCTISSGANYHAFASDSGQCFETTGTTTLTGTPAFAVAYAGASVGGNVTSHTKTYSGSATGKRFSATYGSIIGAATLTTFPGNAAGTTDLFSIYYSGDGASLGPYPYTPQGAWTTFSPGVVSTTGTLTSVTVTRAAYKRIDRTVHCWWRIALTTIGTGAGRLRIDLPFAAQGSFLGTAHGYNSATFKTISGMTYANATTIDCTYYDGTFPFADGQSIFINMTYEAAA